MKNLLNVMKILNVGLMYIQVEVLKLLKPK